MATSGRRGRDEFRLRRLDKPEEFRAVEELQRAAFGLASEAPVSASIQRTWQDHGGIVLGAFADIHLAGAVVGFLGWDGAKLYHMSQMLAVRPEYQHHQLGFRLKCLQRDEVLRQGLDEVRWLIDPLKAGSAALSVRRLGARPDGYKVHYLGQLDGAAEPSGESDRLTVRWSLSDPRTEERLAGKPPSVEDDQRRVAGSSTIVETETGESGLRRPVAVGEPSGESAHLEVPFDISLLKENEPATASTWRHAVRDAFRAAFDLGYRVEDFVVVSVDRERRAFYLLSRTPSSTSAP